jgi:carboxypeptidase C (cathepsin A)
MRKLQRWSVVCSLVCACIVVSARAEDKETVETKVTASTPAPVPPPVDPDSTTEGSVTIGGQAIAYRAVAGTLTVGATDTQDALWGVDNKMLANTGEKAPDAAKPEDAPATARIFYVAYFRKGAAPETRPVMFLYNGGPGSATMWLHMGSFGPKRVVTTDTEHDPGAPYKLVSNDYSLLDATDLVFIDAPGTGFSRIMGKDKEKAFWGTDGDAHAFDRFIRRFLTKYDRWNSPKFLFGESYGTPRSAVLSAMLENVDLNGIVLLSTILSFDNSIDGPRWNPGVEQPYAIALPTYAATAYYHHRLPQQPASLESFLKTVETFAMNEYLPALMEGSEISDARKQAVAEKLHEYTGLPVAYLLKADLRVTGGQFAKTLQEDEGLTTGRLDSRYNGPDIDRLSEFADYDPQDVAISSAYTTAINHYLRSELKYGQNQTYQPGAYSEPGFTWDLRHQAPGGPPAQFSWSGTNVMPDLAITMKSNPKMKVMLAGGYFDLATPFYEGMYEMHHLQIPQSLQSNISYHYYESGHMVYVNEDVLKKLHGDVAAFVRSASEAVGK